MDFFTNPFQLLLGFGNWMVVPFALGFTVKAPSGAAAPAAKPAPPPTPPTPSSATTGTRSLIRDVAGQRSRGTTVLANRQRDRLTPGLTPGFLIPNSGFNPVFNPPSNPAPAPAPTPTPSAPPNEGGGGNPAPPGVPPFLGVPGNGYGGVNSGPQGIPNVIWNFPGNGDVLYGGENLWFGRGEPALAPFERDRYAE